MLEKMITILKEGQLQVLIFQAVLVIFIVIHLVFTDILNGEISLYVRQLSSQVIRFEVGANVGTETVGFSDILGVNGQVIAIEPLPDNIKSLENISRQVNYKNISTIPIALSDQVQILEFTVPPKEMSGIGHLIHEKEKFISNSIHVQCQTLDSLIQDIGKAKAILLILRVKSTTYTRIKEIYKLI